MSLRVEGITKSYQMGPNTLKVLNGVSLEVPTGQKLCILGASGAGKSTLLHIMGTLDQPDSGDVFFKGEKLSNKPDSELARFRNLKMGFVFQFHHLLNEFSALENVALPLRINGKSKEESLEMSHEMLAKVGLIDRSSHLPMELSGGEQQRVAIARALIMKPEVLLADEPTGNLDTANSHKIQDLLFETSHLLGLTLIVVTHDTQFSYRFARTIQIRDGKI